MLSKFSLATSVA
jgi:alpha-amylase